MFILFCLFMSASFSNNACYMDVMIEIISLLAELSESLKITRRTLVEHRTTGLIPYYRLGGRILYKEKDIIKLLDENRLEAF